MDDFADNKPFATQELNIQPPASIYGTFARYNYKMWYAIAEFVDNSTSSFFKNESIFKFIRSDHLNVDIIYDSNAGTLRIEDNAYGMELPDFERAILLNAKPENSDGRNEFGMGLKTAASWFGKKWTVISSQYGSKRAYKATVDIARLEKEKINNIEIETFSASPNEHGTTILIENLNRKIEGSKTVSKIKDILRSMYRRDLTSGHITITYNHEPLLFTPYQVLSYKDKEWRENLNFYFDFDGINHHVTGFVALLGQKDSGFKKAGFALFRRNRVVIGSEGDYYKPQRIFGEAQSKISHKLFGELDLDDFQINQAKDGFVWDDGLEEKFIESLRIQIEEYIRLANITVKERENSFDPKDIKQIEAVKTSTQNSLNVLLEPKSLNESLPNDEQSKSEKETEYEKIFGVGSPDEPENIYEETRTDYTVPDSGRKESKITVTWTSAGSKYWYEFGQSQNEVKINIDHPFFKPFCESKDFRNVLNKFVISLMLAERRAQVGQKDGYAFVQDINNYINDILKELAKE